LTCASRCLLRADENDENNDEPNMLPNDLTINSVVAQADHLADRFERLVAPLDYETKGVLLSEMLFLYAVVEVLREAGTQPGRLLESGRARAQSTLIASLCLPDLPIVSVERNPDHEDAAVAERRLRGRDNVECLFGDSRIVLAQRTQPGDVVLIDGPKDFRALKLAARLLRNNKPGAVLIHDCVAGYPVRRFIDRSVPWSFAADAPLFVERFRRLDPDETIPPSLLCIPAKLGFPTAMFNLRVAAARGIDNLRRSVRKRRG